MSGIKAEFCIEADATGFCINCNLVDGATNFDEKTIPEILIYYARVMSKQMGMDFAEVLKSSMINILNDDPEQPGFIRTHVKPKEELN